MFYLWCGFELVVFTQQCLRLFQRAADRRMTGQILLTNVTYPIQDLHRNITTDSFRSQDSRNTTQRSLWSEAVTDSLWTAATPTYKRQRDNSFQCWTFPRDGLYITQDQVIEISTPVITEKSTNCSTCQLVIDPRTSCVCCWCCWTYHWKQLTWIISELSTDNFRSRLKTFLFTQHWIWHLVH